MKKDRWAAAGIIAVFMVTLIAGLVRASDISSAQYKTTVGIGNNGTAVTHQVTPFSLNTTDAIYGGMVNATAEDVSMVGGGVDIAVMPGVGSNPWMTHVAALGQEGTVLQYLYSGGVTGGKIRYFPGSTGMSANDSATLELGDNWTIEQRGLLNTSTTGANLTSKGGAIRTYVSASGSVATFLVNAVEIINEATSDTYIMYGGGVTRAEQRLDDFPASTISRADFYLKKSGSPTGTGTATVRAVDGDALLGTLGTLDVSTVTTGNVWYTFDTAVVVDTAQDIRVQFEYSGGGGSDYIRFNRQGTDVCDAHLTSYDPPNYTDEAGEDATIRIYADVGVTAAGIAAGERTVRTTANVTHLAIYVDDVLKASTTLAANVTDNAEVWYFAQGDAWYFLEYQDITINGVLQQRIMWEYNAVEFTDRSGNSHNVDPTFRTTASDADLWGYVMSQEGVISGSTPTVNVSGGWTMVEAVPETPEDLFTEGGDEYGIGDFNIGELVTDRAEEAGYDPDTWHFLLAYGLSAAAMAGVYKVSMGKLKLRGSLFAATIAGGVVMAIFYRYTTIPGFTLIPYGLMALGLVLWRKSPSPID